MKTARRAQARREFAKDVALLVIGFIVALWLGKVGAIDGFVSLIGSAALASFIAGLFFTSAFTLAPASIALVNIAENSPFAIVALWGALGAMCGDLILFFFIRDRFADDLLNSLRPSVVRHVLASFHFGFLKWLSPVLGALVIASPLPDEFGLMLMGMSKIRTAVLMPISFVMNALGIYLLVLAAQAL